MKKFMQVGLFMGTFLLSSQLFGQTTEKRGELPVCPKMTDKTDAPKSKSSMQDGKTVKMKAEISPKLPMITRRTQGL